MTHFIKASVIGLAAALFALGGVAYAQEDDLDALLNDLENDSEEAAPKPAAKEEKKADAPKPEEKKAEPAKPAAEEKKADAPKAEEKKAEDVATAPSPSQEKKADAPKAEEKKAEDVATAPSPSQEKKAEDVATAPSPSQEKKAEPAKSAAKEEKKAEDAEGDKDDDEKAEDEKDDDAEKAEKPAAEKKVEKPAEKAPAAAKDAKKDAKPTAAADPDAELLEDIRATEELRRRAFDMQAKREVDEARKCMLAEEFEEAARHYAIAQKLINDSPASKGVRRECDQGIAEGYYRAALQEDHTGRRARAVELMEKAVDFRHPKARKVLEGWLTATDPNERVTDVSAISHRRNEKDFKEMRDANRKHLRRARQLLAVRDIDRALVECELVLVKDPYNQEAIALREAISRKAKTILGQEFEAAREGMIADVERKWRPVYAPNAREIEKVSASTVKAALGEDDPERKAEQVIVKRMKDMRLPTISFKPPATIIDAVEFFRGASKDFDRPEIPLEQRGFNFVLKTPEAIKNAAAAAKSDDDEEGFGDGDDDEKTPSQAGVPVIPMITASDISFYDALKLVCESVDYKFKVQGQIVMVMQKNMSTEEMVTRSYPVLAQFLERMGSASEEMKEMKTATGGFGGGSSKKDDGEESKEQDWKRFFELMGVQWPEGSSIYYLKTIGKLRVKNTYENLAELEKALTELNVDQKLIEIETRFVEVEQEDLNSLGFEWILNDNYTVTGGWLGNKWGKNGGWAEDYTSTSTRTKTTTDGGVTLQDATTTTTTGSGEQRWMQTDMNGNALNSGIAGINAFGGTSDYSNGSRYLSTTGNHISGTGESTNDQFMRVNAFLGSADLSMILHMLAQRSDTDLLNAPKVLTRPGEEAVIKVVTEYIYPTDYDVQLQSSSSSSGSSSSGSGSQSAVLAVVEPQSFTMREVGVILIATPTLTDDGNLIDLKINTQVVDEPYWKDYGMRIPFTGNSSMSSFEGIQGIFDGVANIFNSMGTAMDSATKTLFANAAMDSALSAMDNLSTQSNIEYYKAPMEQPWFHVRSVDSNVSIYPGATMVMGGLITEERKAMDDKIPFLGDIPYIGRFFRSHAEKTTKRNLLIFVTTRLVDVRGREVTMGSNETKEAEAKTGEEDEEGEESASK